MKFNRNCEMNGSTEIVTSLASMQSINYGIKALRHVFEYLETHELLSASRVCTAWHFVAMNKNFVSITLKCHIMYFCLFIKYF